MKFRLKLFDEQGFQHISVFSYSKIIGGVRLLNLGCIFYYLAIRTGIKTHADHYNIVCEAIHDDNNRVHALIA